MIIYYSIDGLSFMDRVDSAYYESGSACFCNNTVMVAVKMSQSDWNAYALKLFADNKLDLTGSRFTIRRIIR